MENLKALVYKGDLTPYQRALAQREFEGLIERLELYEKAVKNNAVLPHVSGSASDRYRKALGYISEMIFEIEIGTEKGSEVLEKALRIASGYNVD